jgi:dynactin complex subunit
MAIANLHETIQSSILRKAQLQIEISELQARKTLATYSQADLQSLLSSEKHSVRDYFKAMYENDPELQAEYLDYTQIPDFEEAIDKITAEFQDQLDELTTWETAIDAQITTNSAELEEINAYLESYKSMLSSNIQEDYNFGLN